MKSAAELQTLLRQIDHKSYPAYKDTRGQYQFQQYVLSIDHVQGDPFAAPSKVSLIVPGRVAGFDKGCYGEKHRRIAFQDYLLRRVAAKIKEYSFKAKGSGKSGLMGISQPGQEILERSACTVNPADGQITIRMEIGFPANGRTINAGELVKILFDFLPVCVKQTLLAASCPKEGLEKVLHLADDQLYIRQQLKERELVAFVADGAILPRKSGVSSQPMKDAVAFASPQEMAVTLQLPHKGTLRGMGIRKGVTLIVGGGYHGKSTLLEALEKGVYDHIAGDGREYVLTDDSAMKLRAEDGRSIQQADISMFIRNLPGGKDTSHFYTEDASGSTSQAAGVVEGIEAGTRLFLIDEDTSATNFMVRDEFMQQVISREKEPITPFLERARDLYEKAGVSSILVAGSSGAFFYIADTILQMDSYRPVDITARVKQLCRDHTAPRVQAPDFKIPGFSRVLPPSRQGHEDKKGGRGYGRGRGGSSGRDAGGRPEHMKIKTFGRDSFSLDRETVDLRYLEQLADTEQLNALAHLLRLGAEQVLDGKKTVQQVVRQIYDSLEKKGWEPFCSSYVPCGLAKPRIQEVYACVNRYRG